MFGIRRSAMWVTCACLLVLCGCADERPPINRVQANALAKAFFVGDLQDESDNPEFYLRVTVVDVSMGAGGESLFTNSDAMPTSRVRFEITENLLVARLTYELIDDTDFRGARNSENGQVVAAYRIEKHFDIQREYNESTGEELNIIGENEDDAPWYARRFFRVDWSQNLVTTAYDFDTTAQIGLYSAVEYEPIAYYVSDPDDPHRPEFDVDRGYFDITNKVYAKPQMIEDEYGSFPACFILGAFPDTSCNPSELTLRQAYLKVGDRDYEPLHYDGARMDMFGYFTVDRLGYDRGYGVVDDRWRRFATRWNLYEQTHADPPVPCATPETTPVGADPHRDEDLDGTEDECASVGEGSRCNEFTQKCVLPLAERQVRTIAWHVGRGFPEELFESTAEALKAWSDALRVAVLAGQLAECRYLGYENCEADFGWPAGWADDYVPPVGNETFDQVPEIFVLCHNPVDPDLGDDVEHCGPAGTSPRMGDLRYNLINFIQDPELAAPWGIMMDVEDPLTGEKIAGSVTEWGSVLDQAAAGVADILALLNGDVDPESYITGQNISDWIASNRPGGRATRQPPLSAGELARRQAAFDPQVIEPYLAGLSEPRPGTPPQLKAQIRERELIDHGRLGPGNDVLSARMRALKGTPIEVALARPELVQAAGFDPTGPVTDAVLERASPVGRMNPTVRRAQRRQLMLSRAKRHSCVVESPEPDNLLGLALQVRQRFGAPDSNDPASVRDYRNNVILWLRQEFNRGVMAHELGHSMGLRHNFAGSFDSLNYAPEYWQLRTRNGTATADCAPGTGDGTDCVAPRYRDPITQEEIDNDIGRYATTTVMDYPGDPSQDVILPGKYDRAAVRFGYANIVDVWAEGSVDASGSEQLDAFRLTTFTQSPGLFGVQYFPPVDPLDPFEFIHYSQYQNTFGLLRNCRAEDGGVLGQRCDQRPMDVVDFRDMFDFAPDPDYEQFSFGRTTKAVDVDGRVRRGYMFSGDEYADSGNVPAFSSDNGADAYEQIRFLEGQYENRYVLDAFRRNRVQFNSLDTVGRTQVRYLDKIQLIAKAFAFGALLEGDPANLDSEILADGFYGPLQVASTFGLDLFARILTRPEPGLYCVSSDCGAVTPVGVLDDVYVADPAPLPDLFAYDFRVALGDGRYLHNDFDYSQGYWWGDYQTQVGTYYDKIWATYYLAEAFDTFISSAKEDFTDSRYKNVNFATVFPDQVRRLYNNLLTGDLEAFAPWVDTARMSSDPIPLGQLEYPEWFGSGTVPMRPDTALLVDPNYAWNEQIYAMVWGALYFPTNWSQNWVHDARIALLPSEAPDWPADEVIAFYYPPTGHTYRAHSTGLEEHLGYLVERSAGARMLEWANWLTTFVYETDTDAMGQTLFNTDGSPVLLLDIDGNPVRLPDSDGEAAVLSRYVDNIDTFRQVTALFEQGLYEGDLPDL